MNRREMIRALSGITATGLVFPMETLLAASRHPSVQLQFFTDTELAVLSAIADLIIPETDTPGAIGAGVPLRIDAAIALGGTENYKLEWRAGLKEVESALTTFKIFQWADVPFLEQSPDDQFDSLEDYDDDIYSSGDADVFYRDLKDTIVYAYYTSEVGATKELRYAPIPGGWEPCVPVESVGRAWADPI